MSIPPLASHRGRRTQRAASVILLCLCGMGALYLKGRQEPKPPQPVPVASPPVHAPSEPANPEPSGEPTLPLWTAKKAPAQPPEISPDIFTPRQWSGPQFLRFFAHDPAGSQELETAYNRWRLVNFTIATKVTQLALERAEVAKRVLWNRAELDQALRWVGELSEGETKFALLAELGKRLFAFDRAGAANLSGQFTRNLYHSAYLGEIVEEWAVKDPEGSSTWVEAFPPGELRDGLQLKVAIRSAGHQPAAAAAYVASLDPGATRDTAARTVARQWAASDPRAAARWAALYPGEELRYELLSTAVAYWTRTDAPGMRRWIEENPTEPVRQAAAELRATLQAPTGG